METYSKRYSEIKKQEEKFIKYMLDDVVSMFTMVWLHPIVIGNMVYYYCRDDWDNEVPAYCYLSDYEKGTKDFKPIYDKLGYQEYGWENIEDVVRILDLIKNKFKKELHINYEAQDK